MSYYSVEPWQNQSRQPSWEHPPSRSGASSSTGGRDEQGPSFVSQMEEVERAIENLARSGKLMPMGAGGGPSSFRRDPMMMGGPPASSGSSGGSNVPGGPGAPRPSDFGGPSHHGPPPSRHHSMSDFDTRPGSHGHGPHNSSNVQGFYQNQRYGGGQSGPQGGHAGGRKSEADQMQQAQRRMAAQRERELRNYHQEQQYNRGKPERTMSPNMSEEERRDLIARQHRALYGDEQNPAGFDGRGPSPMSYPSFGPNVPKPDTTSQTNAGDHPQAAAPSSQTGSNNTPPVGVQGNASMPRTGTSSPKDPLPAQGGSSPSRQHTKTMSVGVSVAPIGTRPTTGSISQGTKRSTPPATSPLGIASTDRAPSSASNPGKDNNNNNNNSSGGPSSGGSNAWGSSSGVWGKNPLGVQASVWG